MSKSKMGGMKLSQFSGIRSNETETPTDSPQESTPETVLVKESAPNGTKKTGNAYQLSALQLLT